MEAWTWHFFLETPPGRQLWLCDPCAADPGHITRPVKAWSIKLSHNYHQLPSIINRHLWGCLWIECCVSSGSVAQIWQVGESAEKIISASMNNWALIIFAAFRNHFPYLLHWPKCLKPKSWSNSSRTWWNSAAWMSEKCGFSRRKLVGEESARVS